MRAFEFVLHSNKKGKSEIVDDIFLGVVCVRMTSLTVQSGDGFFFGKTLALCQDIGERVYIMLVHMDNMYIMLFQIK